MPLPVVVYVFSLCTFAFGLSEFVVAGLVSAMAADLGAPISAVGAAIAAYAFGAAIGAPLLTALVAHWQDRNILILAMLMLALGSVAMSLAPTLGVLLAVRFIVGLGHGVFMAVASDAATRLVDPQRAGRALSVVWVGLTLALALGVPLGTLLGSLWSWRGIFLAIALLGLAGVAGLLLCMRAGPDPAKADAGGAWTALKAITHAQLLVTAAVGVLVSVATFCFFTFVSPYLLQVTALDVSRLSVAMLLFGVCSILGNLLGGWLADTGKATGSTLAALGCLALNLLALYLCRGSAAMMLLLVGSLGVCFFCIVTLLTLRLLTLAQRHVPAASAVAAGLNIASFNLGTALGGALGSLAIAGGGLVYLPLPAALAALLAAALLWWQGVAQLTHRQPRNGTT